MKKFILTFAVILITLSSLVLAKSKPEFPAGWKPATESDYASEDLSFTKQQVPNHIEADFNSDGIVDDAWILTNTAKNTFGLFVLLRRKDGTHTMLSLDENKRETEKLFMGISLIEPGQYKTACGKGYWDCKGNEPEVLTLKSPGISYFSFESAHSVFFWDSSKKEFTRIWMSD
ncbi:MAG: hypothetical protein ACOZBW_13430 [Thermodesulfobacteriota bacterium]